MKSSGTLSCHMPYFLAASLLSFLLTACGGRMLNKNMAQDLVAGLPGDILNREDVYVEAVNMTDSRNAVIQTRLNAAFRFQRVGARWIPREVRLGNSQWESIENLVEALQRVKRDQTQTLLNTIAESIGRYCLKNGGLPPFGDYISLSDVLVPDYLTPLIRLDAWQHPLSAVRLSVNSVKLISAGPDGKLGSGDDIELVKTFPSN
jgi:hypothetical protein